jgi:hypothetical protein
MLTGWSVKSTNVAAPAAGPPAAETSVELAQFDARLAALMGFVQLDFTDRAWLVPFVGVGAGCEWLTLDAEDDQTGLKSEANYANMAWQAYIGIGLRLTSKVRPNSELYYNAGSLNRDVIDASGHTWREAVDVNGVGLRVGLDSIFE